MDVSNPDHVTTSLASTFMANKWQLPNTKYRSFIVCPFWLTYFVFLHCLTWTNPQHFTKVFILPDTTFSLATSSSGIMSMTS